MNYKLHYEKLILRGKNRKLDCYKEIHHIVPRSMNGTDDKENLVELTAREHFIAHILLLKIYPGKYSLIKAVSMMCVIGTGQDRSMNRMYGWLREKFSEEMSRSQTGEGNSQFGTMWIHNLELKESKKVPKGEIPEGWLKGRKMKFGKSKKESDREQRLLEKQTNIKEKTEFVNRVLDTLEDNKFESIAEMLREGFYEEYYSSKLTNILKRYNCKRYEMLIQPRFNGKTTNRKDNER